MGRKTSDWWGMRVVAVAVLGAAGCNDRAADAPAPTASGNTAPSLLLSDNKDQPMSANKRTVQKYMEAFSKSDHAEVLSCLADDVEWVIPGMFHVNGKEAFDKEIENDAFVGSPTITVTRMVEENDVVVAEGNVRATKKDGSVLNAVFCDVFILEAAKIRQLTSYLMEVKQ